jgi:nicotinamidase-related amidase
VRGEVKAWDKALFAKTVRQTGKKTLIRGGVWTSACVMFPAPDAKAAGFKTYVVMDASGEGTGLTAKGSLPEDEN